MLGKENPNVDNIRLKLHISHMSEEGEIHLFIWNVILIPTYLVHSIHIDLECSLYHTNKCHMQHSLYRADP